MKQTVHKSRRWIALTLMGWLSVMVLGGASVSAQLTPLPIPDPQPGGFGLEATKTQPPPTEGATISVPGNGASFTTSPIDVQGICPDGLLVQIYNNNVMVGAVMCEDGSFRLQISLFAGSNDLQAIVYDSLGQAGPESGITSVTYTDTNMTAFGELVTLTSNYGRRSAAAGTQLSWPVQLAGGTGPYAISIDWGDGSDSQLVSQSLAGLLNIMHTYRNAGIYQVNIRATDSNGVSAFLQLVAVSNGEADTSVGQADAEGELAARERIIIIWIPAVIALLLLIPTYWLGRRSQLVSLRHKMTQERDKYQEK